MVKLESAVSLASLGLIVMFILLLFSFVSCLIDPDSQCQERVVVPQSVLITIISISAAPGIILAGITYGLIKNYGSKKIGIVLCVSGIVLLIGIILIHNMIPKIPQTLFASTIDQTVFVSIMAPLTWIFLAAGIGIIIIGIIAYMREGKRERPVGEENF
jgi:bacteriorhodopsin